MGGTNEIGFDGSDSNYAYYIRHDFMISLEKLDKPPLGESYSLYTIEEYEEYMKNLEANTDCAKKIVGGEGLSQKEFAEQWSKFYINKAYNKILEEEALKQYEVPTGSIKIWDLRDGYIFKDENGNVINTTKIVLEKKKKEYPKTYEECVKCIKSVKEASDRAALLCKLERLLVCRDAYWKLYGEEMGLGKPWEPNDSSGYCTYAILHHTGHIRKSRPYADSELLEFPTEEMRDAFYENFKELIEICKELL